MRVASIEDVVGKLQEIRDSLENAAQTASGPQDDLGEIRDQLGAIGVEDRAQHCGQAAEAVEKTRGLMAQAVDAVEEAINLAAAAGGG